jgi:hypothetical protein
MAQDNKKKNVNATQLQLWFEHAWEGWIRPLGLMFLLAIGYMLYKFEIVGELISGLIAVLAIVVGAIVVGALPALPLTRAPWHRALLATMVAVALGGMVYPAVRATVPGKTYAHAELTNEKPSATLTTGAAGPYELLVSGHFKEAGRSDAEASYSIKATDKAGASDEVSGEIARKLVTIRSRKGSSSTLSDLTEQKERLAHVRGPQVTLTADGVDEQLEGGLLVALRPGGLDPIVFVVLGALAILMGLVLDTRLFDTKGKQTSNLTAATSIAFAFMLYYSHEVTPSRLVRTAVSALLFALLVGGVGGFLVGTVARLLFGPKPPKKVVAKR